MRLIEALIVRLHRYCRDRSIDLPRRNFTVEYSSDIPFGVGLGGSSIIAAVFLALMDFYDRRRHPQAGAAHHRPGDRDRGAGHHRRPAGPGDRRLRRRGRHGLLRGGTRAHGGRHGDYRPLPPKLLPPLFVAWDERLSKSSGAVHNAMRYRAAIEHDPAVIEAMACKAALWTRRSPPSRRPRLGPIMDRDFDLRRSVYDLPADQVRMIDIARRHGSHAKFAGSGGAVICEDDAPWRGFAEAGISVVGARRPPPAIRRRGGVNAILLAAGYGTRIRSLFPERPRR